jgi:integrase
MNAEAPVFPLWTPAAFTVAFGRLVRDLKVGDLHFHDLRHDTASTLTMAGVPQRTVMALLGHRDPRMTLRYQHFRQNTCGMRCGPWSSGRQPGTDR